MTRVALLVRVSTDKQDYNRQITELQEHCEKMNWGGGKNLRKQGVGCEEDRRATRVGRYVAVYRRE